MISLLRRIGNKFLEEIDGYGPFQSSAAVESLSEMAFTGQRIVQKIMKRWAHRLNSKIVGAISKTTDPLQLAIKTTTLDLSGLLAKTLEVKVSLIS